MARRPGLFFNPWFQLGLEAFLVTAAEVFLKLGASTTVARGSALEWLGVTGLTSMWVWVGICFFASSFLSWSYVLRHVPLSIAYPLSNSVYILVPISSWLFLSEKISGTRWCGVFVVIAGLALVAKPVARMENKL